MVNSAARISLGKMSTRRLFKEDLLIPPGFVFNHTNTFVFIQTLSCTVVHLIQKYQCKFYRPLVRRLEQSLSVYAEPSAILDYIVLFSDYFLRKIVSVNMMLPAAERCS